MLDWGLISRQSKNVVEQCFSMEISSHCHTFRLFLANTGELEIVFILLYSPRWSHHPLHCVTWVLVIVLAVKPIHIHHPSCQYVRDRLRFEYYVFTAGPPGGHQNGEVRQGLLLSHKIMSSPESTCSHISRWSWHDI